MRNLLLTALLAGLALPAIGQKSSSNSSNSSSSSSGDLPSGSLSTGTIPRIAQPEYAGSAITLETSEPLFDLAVSLNACGYDADLDQSNPVRRQVRDEVNEALAASAPARDARDALCAYIREHSLNDAGRSLAQYVSLALYLSPPPELVPNAGEGDMAADATQVVTVLPLVRTFVEEAQLHAVWIRHRPQYEALVNHIHDPLTKMFLGTNIYLRLPVSSYDGRRFLVLIEPMLSPAATNARIYANDFIVAVSPAGPDGTVPVDSIRHTYLHYEVEPLVYAKASAMDRLLPLLKPVQDSPLDFAYKSDIVSLLTECLIKAIETQTMDVGIPKPARPANLRERVDIERFDSLMAAYNSKAEVVRRQTIDREMREGWVLTDYFYGQLNQMEKDSISLKEYIGQMVYGMEVDRQRKKEEQIVFLPANSTGGPIGSGDVRRAPRQLTGLNLAEMKLMKGDALGAEEIATKALADPAADHAEAHYVLARIDLMDGNPEEAVGHFAETLKASKDPRTLAWSHIYLGRLYDAQITPDRPKALAEYHAALTVRDSQPDTKAAAEQGIKTPFAAPKRTAPSSDEPDQPLDPSGKAEKEAYRSSQPKE